MAITLDTTVAGADSNSYADVDQANARAELRAVSPLAEAWLADTTHDERKKSALISATADINSVLASGLYLSGTPLTDTQALFFPTEEYPSDYPQFLVDATIELAFTLLPAAITATSEPLDPVVNDKKRIKADDVEIEYFAPAKTEVLSFTRWPGIVQRLLAPLLQILVTEGVWGTGEALRTS